MGRQTTVPAVLLWHGVAWRGMASLPPRSSDIRCPQSSRPAAVPPGGRSHIRPLCILFLRSGGYNPQHHTYISGVQPRCSEGLRVCRARVGAEASHSHGAEDTGSDLRRSQRKHKGSKMRGGALSELSDEDSEVSERDKRRCQEYQNPV
ncbi:hypothetical protein E2C01_063646 [Portunus trituberculatus]|uniref:Uncharacterized protein n=1 Tax=Portunus trituberculatus TaxID=210409 RepID=A0A5B7H9P6_PORTR|nr:hypothetical protein [Portunus trituberculatus]